MRLVGNDNRPKEGLTASQLSLRAFFVLTVAAACVSRLAARFGFAVLMLLGWSACVGTAIGAIVAVSVTVSQSARHGAEKEELGYAHLRHEMLQVVFAGLLGGTVTEFGAYMLVALLFNPHWTETRSMWVEVSNSSGSNPSPSVTVLVLFPAIVGALSNAIVTICRRSTLGTFAIVARVAVVTAFICALPSFAFFVYAAALVVEGREQGLMPFAALIYLAGCAAAGAVAGTVCAALRICIRFIRDNQTCSRMLWPIIILTMLFITEAAVRGWLSVAVASAFRN